MANNFKPTASQQEVLMDNSKNLLVSASAGSGKTATIIQKILNLIVKNKIDLQELLVITFTESASLEMKIRLKEKLFEEVGKDSELIKQIDKLPTSDISTIHGFCSKCIRKYFYELDLNPNFLVLDGNNANFLKGSAINKVIEFYSSKQDEDFVMLSQIFGGGRNFSSLKENVLACYEFLCSVDNRDDYINKVALSCYNSNLSNNPASEVLNSYILSNCYYVTSTLKDYLTIAEIAGANYFVEFIKNFLNSLSEISYKKDFLSNRNNILKIEIPTLTRKKLEQKDSEFKSEFKPFFDEAKKIVEDLVKNVSSRPIEELKDELTKTSKTIEKFLEVENAFEMEYENLKKKRNSLDFNDLERYFLNLLNVDRVKQAIQDSYKYIFVDEYQDINNVQELILSKLTSNNNIVMVGDVKQSIYGFRNSTPSIFVNKSIDYNANANNGTLINLNENFRSNPQILNFVNEIFNACMSREFGGVDYKETGKLCGMTKYEVVNDEPIVDIHFVNTKKDDGDVDEIEENYPFPYSIIKDKNEYQTKYSVARREAVIVARKILDLITKNYYDAKTGESKKITFGDIAILSRKNEFLKQVANVLTEYKIPVTLNSSDNIYKDSDVNTILSILKIVNNSHDDVSLSVALTSFLGNVSFDELACLRCKYSSQEFMYESVNEYIKNERDELQQKLNNFFNKINEFREGLVYLSIYELLCEIQKQYDFLNTYRTLPNGEERYNTLKAYIDSFEGAEYNYDLNKYIDYVENYAKNADAPNAVYSNPNSVKMGTIHSSKGLEYPIVFLVGCGKSFSNRTFNSEVLKDKTLGIGMNYYNLEYSEKYSTLARNAITINIKKQEKAEELRLLYVALTRAKNHLIIIGSKNINSIARIKNFREAQAVNCFANWLLCGLSDVAFNSLKQGKTEFLDKHKTFDIKFNVYSDNFFDANARKEINLNLKTVKNNEVNKLLNSFNYRFEKSNKLALKNTVSSMLQEHSNDGTSLNFEPKKLEITEFKKEGIDASKLGTIYHNIMQKVEFKNASASNLENVEKIINNLNLENKYRNKVSVNKISKCVKIIQDLGIKEVNKEQPFLSYLPYNYIFKNSDITDKILIQGVADLIVDTGRERILIDYKTTKAKSKDQLVEKYEVQLNLYKICLQKATNKNIDKVFIYSFWFDELIPL